LPENEEAERIYMTVQDQYIVGMGGAVALNQMAIHKAMELYEIQDKRTCFEKVVLVGREVLKSERDKGGK
jgi:hypothetical protein